MTREEIMQLDKEGIEARKAEMKVELEQAADDAALDSLEAERAIIEERTAILQAEIETRKANMQKVIGGTGEKIEKPTEEKTTMNEKEIRSSKEYLDAYVEYLKTEDDKECRALLSTNAPAGGQVPVPTYVEDRIHTAWDRTEIMGLVRKTYIKGNYNVGFELTADPAYDHIEGSAANTEEALTFGVVELIPKTIKKWIKVSDEAIDLKGEAFIDYIFDELSYRVSKKEQANLIAKIIACTASATSTEVGVGVVTGTPSVGVVADAIGELSDEASNPVIVMNKKSWSKFKAAQYAASYPVDPFEGLPVHFDNSLPAYTSSGTTGSTWCLVGDFGIGAQANYPNGAEIVLKYDDTTLSESDLVKITGRRYVALGAVSDHAFTKIVF